MLLAALAYAQGSQEPGEIARPPDVTPEAPAPKKEPQPQRARRFSATPDPLAQPQQRVNAMRRSGGFSTTPPLDLRIDGEGLSLPVPAAEPPK